MSTFLTSVDSPSDLLARAYRELDLDRGLLVRAGDGPPDLRERWDAIGEWVILAQRMGAERVFFVGDDPVIVFVRLDSSVDESALLQTYRRAWSLARPRCLFLATDDELRVYSLAKAPSREEAEGRRELTPIEIVSRSADVATQLAAYHRERIEAGLLFEDPQFRVAGNRADYLLLNDVRRAAELLEERGLPKLMAQALIERSILIRYLEDRGVVTPDYFEEVAGGRPSWQAALSGSSAAQGGFASSYTSALLDYDLAYAVFDRLAADFNGDLFRIDAAERARVDTEHLALLNQLLTGSGFSAQQALFLWAYDFSVVPTSLISSMYEQFYHLSVDDRTGTHYTPPELVEYVLSKVLTDEVLASSPRICDPACGSGVFLVEAFRRLVRHEMVASGGALSSESLRELLLTRVAGIDINEQAIRLAAFSLYLALLNYQSPSDIRQAGPLPSLIGGFPAGRGGVVLAVADAFAPTLDEGLRDAGALPWPRGHFDVLVGNPPWDEPRGGQRTLPDRWQAERGLPVGERSRSQLFLWRSLDLVRSGGIVALLVNATAMHNARSTSKQFRAQWLGVVALDSIVNFTPAREVFFSGGISPFFLLVFQARQPEPGRLVEYRTLRPSLALTHSKSVTFASADRRWVSQESLRRRDYLWKTYAWGSYHDDKLMSRLDAESTVREYLPEGSRPGYGYQFGSDRPSPVLAELRSLRSLESFGPLDPSWFESSPRGVKRQPSEALYTGTRILVSRGVQPSFGPKVRLVNEDFSFRHTIYGIPVQGLSDVQAKSIVATILSKLGRYRIFMTSASWGVWHDSIVPDDILALPIRMPPEQGEIARRVVSAVDGLAASFGGVPDLFRESTYSRDELLHEIDDAIYDLFELSPAERDLVDSFAGLTLDLVNRKARSDALAPLILPNPAWGSVRDLSVRGGGLYPYLETFVRSWNRELAPVDGELRWEVVGGRRQPLIAAVFSVQEAGNIYEPASTPDWDIVLGSLGAAWDSRHTAAVRSEGVLRSTSESSVVVVRRNEARLWTSSTARDDAEATMIQAMRLRSA